MFQTAGKGCHKKIAKFGNLSQTSWSPSPMFGNKILGKFVIGHHEIGTP